MFESKRKVGEMFVSRSFVTYSRLILLGLDAQRETYRANGVARFG